MISLTSWAELNKVKKSKEHHLYIALFFRRQINYSVEMCSVRESQKRNIRFSKYEIESIILDVYVLFEMVLTFMGFFT